MTEPGSETARSVRSPRRPALVVAGSLMMDLVMRVARRPGPGETLFGSDFGMFLGGKGFNQAVAARKLGAAVSIIGRVGDDDFGRALRAALVREGVDTAGVSTDPMAGTGVAAPLIEESGENSIVSVPRANMRLTAEDVTAAAGTFTGAAAVLLQLEVPVDASLAAARLAHTAGARVLLNTAPAAAVPEELRAAADLLIANESEAEALTGVRVTAVEEAFAAAERLRVTTAQIAIVTLGAQGAVLLGPDLCIHRPAHAVPVRDTTGAGDAFCGAFAVRLAETGDPRDALAWAVAAGACAVTTLGAEPSLPSREAVWTLLRSDP